MASRHHIPLRFQVIPPRALTGGSLPPHPPHTDVSQAHSSGMMLSTHTPHVYLHGDSIQSCSIKYLFFPTDSQIQISSPDLNLEPMIQQLTRMSNSILNLVCQKPTPNHSTKPLLFNLSPFVNDTPRPPCSSHLPSPLTSQQTLSLLSLKNPTAPYDLQEGPRLLSPLSED